MRRSLSWCALAAAAALSPAARADLVLCGNVTCGTYSVTDEDIYIYNATLVPGAGGTKTLTLIAKNGQIIVNHEPTTPPDQPACGTATSGINGAGVDRAAGSSLAGGTGFNVILETTSGPGPARDRHIIIDFPIDCSGGDGGSGADGTPGHFVNCQYKAATSGAIGGAGGGGGTISITSAEDIRVNGQLKTFGGVGATGGNAGGGLGASPGSAGHGGDGGPGGAVTVFQSAAAPLGSAITFYTNNSVSGSIAAHGGAAGAGGDGAYGNPIPSDGANGGKGGDGGVIVVDGRNVFMSAAIGPCALDSSGGFGGAGGRGADGEQGSCYQYCSDPVRKRTIWSTPGADGGLGGHGGTGGSITIASDDLFSMGLKCGLQSRGGNGAMAGGAGNGSIEVGDQCGTGLKCSLMYAYGPGVVRESGDGGNGGAITIICDEIALAYSDPGDHADIVSEGGDGANGVSGANGAIVCCGTPPVLYDVSPGGGGGQAGTGGNAGDIAVFFSLATHFTDQYHRCGGTGGDGGSGGNGDQSGVWGDGAVGGACGLNGDLEFNSTLQTDTCDSCGSVGGADGLPLTCSGGT